MYFPPIMVLILSAEATELKTMLQETFSDFKVTHVEPAGDNKTVVYVEFGEVPDTQATTSMRDELKSTGIVTGRFHIMAQVF
jgi:hypothetical protein